ncbi:MAG: segregation/condensation protein A [bacterium]|nr:segregation/condensation protein A [bacterium]
MEQTLDHPTNDYRVDLDVFNGPMDLLLFLIKKEEVDIYDIPIARITQQYLSYLDLMRNLNLEVAGEFILMAATLIHIKARLLLPRDENDPEEEDPREELIMALLEYKKYKEAGEILRERALLEETTFVPPPLLGDVKGKVDLSPATTLFDLIAAFKSVLSSRHEEVVHEVIVEEITIEDRIKAVLVSLQDREYAPFIELFEQSQKRIVAVVTFIAILELARTRRVSIQQTAPFTEIRLYRGEYYHVPIQQEQIDIVEATAMTEQAEAV